MKIKVKIKPNSIENEIIMEGENSYIVRINKPAIENKANIELIKVLSRYFKSKVRIISGRNSRLKIIEVENGN